MKVDELKRNMDAQFAKVDARFAKVDERFAQIGERFTKVDERFDTLRRDLETLFRESEEETRRHFETVAEHVTAEIRSLVGDLADTQRQHARQGAEAATGIDTLRAGLDDHEVRLQGLERRSPEPREPRRRP